MKYINYYLIIFVILNWGCISNKEVSELRQNTSILYPTSKAGLWGFNDENGETIIECQFDTVSFFRNGLAVAKENGRYGYIKQDGDWLIKPQYDLADDFDYNCATVYIGDNLKRINYKNRKCTEGTIIEVGGCIPPQELTKKDEYCTKKGDKYAIIYDYYFLPEGESEYKSRKDTSEYIFDDVQNFSQTHLAVWKDEKVGLYEIQYSIFNTKKLTKSENIIEFDYGASKDTLFFAFDELIIEYTDYNSEKEKYSVSNSAFRIDNYWGIISRNSKVIIEPKYHKLKIYNRGLAEVEYEKGNCGYLDFSRKREFFKREKNHL